MTCGLLLDIVLTAMTAIAGRLVAANVLTPKLHQVLKGCTTWVEAEKLGL